LLFDRLLGCCRERKMLKVRTIIQKNSESCFVIRVIGVPDFSVAAFVREPDGLCSGLALAISSAAVDDELYKIIDLAIVFFLISSYYHAITPIRRSASGANRRANSQSPAVFHRVSRRRDWMC
jgi:hypothetical protein